MLADRLRARHGHFFPAKLLAAQLADLEEPEPDERPIIVDIGRSPDELVTEITAALAG
jgi:gluconate kinase